MKRILSLNRFTIDSCTCPQFTFLAIVGTRNFSTSYDGTLNSILVLGSSRSGVSKLGLSRPPSPPKLGILISPEEPPISKEG